MAGAERSCMTRLWVHGRSRARPEMVEQRAESHADGRSAPRLRILSIDVAREHLNVAFHHGPDHQAARWKSLLRIVSKHPRCRHRHLSAKEIGGALHHLSRGPFAEDRRRRHVEKRPLRLSLVGNQASAQPL